LSPILQTALQPRKMPVQARSAASVDAILEATVQVLLQLGKDRLTTRRVAARAGVSIGTLYQYFPNKRSLLQAALRRHMEGVVAAVERVRFEQHGRPLAEMGAALANGLITAKMKEGKTGARLYAVTADVEGQQISQEMSQEMHRIICDMLLSSQDPLDNPTLVTTILQGIMAGISRKLLEATEPEKQFEMIRRELVLTVTAYLEQSSRERRADGR
jgi:AcrR family transcriptional regulator